MQKFSDFHIKIESKAFTGDKVKVSKILNRLITVHAYTIGPSKHNTGDCLKIQIEFNQTKHIVFTGSAALMEQVKQVPQTAFPFTTTIIEDNDRFLFT